jgi:hypothetical protein
MGESYTPVDLVFDTGSDWLAVESFDCEMCEGNTFNADFSGKQVNSTMSLRQYGSISLTGYEYRDKACVSFDQCIDNFLYMAIVNWDQREPVDGMLGLARNYGFFNRSAALSQDPGQLFILELMNNQLIDLPIFSFYLTSESMQAEFPSYVHFGRPERF